MARPRRRILWSPEARADLAEIWSYYAKSAGWRGLTVLSATSAMRIEGKRRNELCSDFVDMAPAVADHKQSRYDAGACGALGDVQVDHQFARAVGIDLIGARFCAWLSCWRRELGWNAVAGIATRGEIAVAVDKLDAGYDLWRTVWKTRWGVVGDSVGVSALQCRVRARDRVLASCYTHKGRLDDAREIVKRLRTITPSVMEPGTRYRNPEFRELFLSGLRLAADDTV
jgi:hypothetical protein